MFQLLGLCSRNMLAQLAIGDITVNRVYNQLYIIIALIACAILGISFAGDVLGHNWVNIAIIPIWVLVVLYIKYYPRALAAELALSTAASKAGLITSIEAGYEKWDYFTKHAAVFGGVFGLTRFLVPIKAYPSMGWVLLGALITLGLWAWLYDAGKAYKKYALGVVLIALVVGLFGTFAGKPAVAGHPAAPISNGLTGILDDITYSKTLDVEVRRLEDSRLCGVKTGKRIFQVPHTVVVKIDGERNDITSALRVNGTHPGEPLVVDSDGCVTVSFAVNGDFKKNAFAKRVIAIRFE